MTKHNYQLKLCSDAFDKWWTDQSDSELRPATLEAWVAWQAAWNTRTKDEAKGGEAVAVIGSTYQLLWIRADNPIEGLKVGDLLYTSPRPTAQADIGAAVTAYQLADLAYNERMEKAGLLFDPALGVEEGLLAALPHLQLLRPTADEARDAARYRYLRGSDINREFDVCRDSEGGFMYVLLGKELDQEIDSAMAERGADKS